MMQEKWKEQSVQQQNALNSPQIDVQQSTQVEKLLAQKASLLRYEVVSRLMLQLLRPEPGERGEAKCTSLESETLKGSDITPLSLESQAVRALGNVRTGGGSVGEGGAGGCGDATGGGYVTGCSYSLDTLEVKV